LTVNSSNPEDKTKATLIFSNVEERDILLRKEFEGEVTKAKTNFPSPLPPGSRPKVLYTHARPVTPYPLSHSPADLAARKPDQFKVVFTLDQPPSGWKGPTGYVNADVVRDALKEFGTTPDKGDKVKVFVCGPPGQVKAISGPKKVRAASSISLFAAHAIRCLICYNQILTVTGPPLRSR
jgi:cytochrome-b5 reductase